MHLTVLALILMVPAEIIEAPARHDIRRAPFILCNVIVSIDITDATGRIEVKSTDGMKPVVFRLGPTGTKIVWGIGPQYAHEADFLRGKSGFPWQVVYRDTGTLRLGAGIVLGQRTSIWAFDLAAGTAVLTTVLAADADVPGTVARAGFWSCEPYRPKRRE